MLILVIVIIVLSALDIIVTISLCKTASRADRLEEKLYLEEELRRNQVKKIDKLEPMETICKPTQAEIKEFWKEEARD